MKKTLFIFAFLLSFTVWAIAQTKPVNGIIVDEAGSPIAGATVLVKGTTLGVASGVDGKFTIQVPENQKVLVISFIGYQTQEQTARPEMKIVLRAGSQDLQEVVVTGMGGRIDKRLFTGATDQLSADKIKLDGMAEISRSLEGRAAGVSVQNVSGTFGAAPKIRVRGATSIYGSSKPLWVVDGIIMDDVTEVDADQLSSGDAVTLISSAIAGLNADDIESFQILKDGSATSIYGARAMAGVIVVTTKRGKAGSSRISYTGEYTIRMKPDYRTFNIMDSQEQMGVYKEMDEKGWLNLSDVFRAQDYGVYGKMYEMINTYDPVTGTFLLQNTQEARNLYLQSAEMRNTDWFDELFNTNIMHSHSISMSSGNEKSTYYASLSALVDPGWAMANHVNRYTANINATYNILKNLQLNLITNASYRKQKAPGTLGQSKNAVTGEVKRQFDINPYSFALTSSRTLDPNEYYLTNYAPFNIKEELANNNISLHVVDLKFQGELKWKLHKTLELSAQGALKYQTTSQEHNIHDASNQANAYRAMGDATIREKNPYLYENPDSPYALPISVLPEGGIYQRTDYRMLGYDFRATASWNTAFKDDTHIVNLFGGLWVSSLDREKTWFNGWGLQYTRGEIPFYVYQFFKQGIEQGSQYYSIDNAHTRDVAFFANATYSYKGIYTLNGTVRYEGSNKLGKSRSARWLPTWNISGAWNIHEESFFEPAREMLSHATLRASYSLTADRGPADVTNSYIVIKSESPWRQTTDTQETSLKIQDPQNSELTYEKKHELNIGADLGFLDNRLNFVADWYKRDNYDLIGIINTQGVGGFITKYANIATMKSHGVEFTLSTKNIQNKDFSWNTDLTFSYTKNEITELESHTRVMDLITGNGFARKGYPVRALFSIPFQGLNEDGMPTFINQKNEVTVHDLDFQERTHVDFLKYEGPTDPKYTGGFGNVFRYKNLRLNVFMTYSFGNKIRLDPAFNYRYTDLTAMPREFKNRWMMAGDEHFTDIPVILSKRQYETNTDLKYAYNAYNYSTARIADGGFIRMKEISLAYDFSQKLIRNWQMSSLSVKLQVTNPFLIYADKKLNGQDPEFFRSGGVAVPVPKQFTFTLRVGF